MFFLHLRAFCPYQWLDISNVSLFRLSTWSTFFLIPNYMILVNIWQKCPKALALLSSAGAYSRLTPIPLKAGSRDAESDGQDIASAHTDSKDRGQHPNPSETHPNCNFTKLKPDATSITTSTRPQVSISPAECEQCGSKKSIPISTQTSRRGHGKDAKPLLGTSSSSILQVRTKRKYFLLHL